ncbi:MAG: T9SS type A sorting domain-containing protein [Calditrichaeota bacterium]|nr:T9SS type A sorting domain-containing protein [Calditrichota bacterium]
MKLLDVKLVLFCIVIIAGSTTVNAETQRDVVGYWTFELNPRFNLVSFPVLPEQTSPQNVIGDRLGSVEITSWDEHLRRHRWTRYEPQSGQWTGDLYLLDRGVAYWINLPDAVEAQRLIVTGHPELYRKFRWSGLRNGWNYYAPTFGRLQSFNDLPPDNSRDLLVSWDNEQSRFEMAEAAHGREWRSQGFESIEPDQGYFVYLNQRVLRTTGPPTPAEYMLDLREDTVENFDGSMMYDVPPHPLIISNKEGLPVCLSGGGICSDGFNVDVIRERLSIGVGGELELMQEVIDRLEITSDMAPDGKFRFVLTVGIEEGVFPGDRICLIAKAGIAETRSTSFEVSDDDWLMDDLNFPEPMLLPDAPIATPADFTLGSPYPNPFNERFQIEFSLPQASTVTYRLFDLQGRTALNETRPFNAGTHRLNLSGRDLVSGIYLFEVTTGQKRGIAKVAFVK